MASFSCNFYSHHLLQAESIHALGEEIGTKLAKAEAMGAEGHVEESMALMTEVEELKKKKTVAEVSIHSYYIMKSWVKKKMKTVKS